MSTLKVDAIRHNSATSDAITTAADGTCTAKLTSVGGGGLSHRNLVINGAMMVSQRGTSFSGTAQRYTLDRMQTNTVGNDEVAQTEQAAVTSGGAYTSGFRKCMKIINGNQTSGAGAGDLVHLKMVLEAQDIANSGWNYTSSSSFITLSFWIKSSVAQDFPITLRSEDGTRQVYNMTTGSLTADTWTKITKTIPGDSNLQFDDDVNAGLTLFVNAFVGTDYTTGSLAQNAWSAWSGTKQGDNMTSTWYTTNNATLEITGIQLEVGDTATSFEHRSYAEELVRCQRYFAIFPGRSGGIPFWQGYAGSSDGYCSIPVPNFNFRAVPTPTDATTGTSSSTGNIYDVYGNNHNSRYAGNGTVTLSCGGYAPSGIGLIMNFGAHQSGTKEGVCGSWNGASPGIFLSCEL